MAPAADPARVPTGIANDSDVEVTQISVVVPALEEGIRTYAAAFGWSSWKIYDFADLAHEDVQVRGRDETYRVRVALTTAGNVDVELIEPVGPSPYSDFLDATGGGLHHVQLVSPTRSVKELLDARRLPVLCSGTFRVGDGGGFGYAIYDARDEQRFIAGAYAGNVSELAQLTHRTVTVGDDGAFQDDPEPHARTSAIDVVQVGLVVDDLDETIGAMRDLLGWGPWRVYDFREVDHRCTTYRGDSASYDMRIATVQAGGLHVEVIAPTGPGPYQDFLDATGPGLHHIQVRGEAPDEAGRQLQAAGATVHMSGRVGIDENSGLDYTLYEGGGLRHLVEVTVGDRGRLMAVLPYEIAAGS